nr:hypothetical protein Iba_chr04bCG12940 [Ipomoea batatas]
MSSEHKICFAVPGGGCVWCLALAMMDALAAVAMAEERAAAEQRRKWRVAAEGVVVADLDEEMGWFWRLDLDEEVADLDEEMGWFWRLDLDEEMAIVLEIRSVLLSPVERCVWCLALAMMDAFGGRCYGRRRRAAAEQRRKLASGGGGVVGRIWMKKWDGFGD